MSDPVADKSGFLCMYMSNHPDTLVAWAKYYGKVTEAITSAQMTSINSKTITLSCTSKAGAKEVRIPIEPPLRGYDDVKPRLLEMKAIAQEQLGMIKAPKITSLYLSPSALISGIIVISLMYLTWSPSDSTSSMFYPAKLAHATVKSTYIHAATYGLLGCHTLESLYTFNLCRRHKTGPLLGAAHVIATVLCGFPIWRDMRKSVQTARIDSVMKIQ